MLSSTFGYSAVPQGWRLSGPAADATSVETMHLAQGRQVALTVSPTASGYVALEQAFDGYRWSGARIQFSAEIQTTDVSSWAGLWLKCEPQAEDGTAAAVEPRVTFDNMQNRPLRGTTPWRRHSVVLDCGADPEISLGIIVDGPGQVALRNLRFERVEKDIPETALCCSPAGAPRNLDFRLGSESPHYAREGWYRYHDVQTELSDGPAQTRAIQLQSGGILQTVSAAPWRGQRVAFSASVNVQGRGGLVLSVHPRAPVFDSRVTVPAGEDWQHARVELDIPNDAEECVFGMVADEGHLSAAQLEIQALGPTSRFSTAAVGALPLEPTLQFRDDSTE